MLSTRGEVFAKAGLADGYLDTPRSHFERDTKQGVVSFSNAENVGQPSTNLRTIPIQNKHVLSHAVVVPDAGRYA